jgi:hypothetical protein
MPKLPHAILLSLALSTSAWAVSGTGVQPGGIDPSCRILVLSQQSKEILGVCSGTLTGPTEVSTAGHCVLGRTLKYFSYQVDCGYSGFDGDRAKKVTLEDGFTFYHQGPIFKESHSVSAVHVGKEFGTSFKGNDVAKLTLAQRSTLTPLSVASTTDITAVYFNPLGQMQDRVECMISGFGESNSNGAGKLSHAALTVDSRLLSLDNEMHLAISYVRPPQDELTEITALLNQASYWLNPAYFRTFVELSGRAALTEMPGDSGSALFCRRNSSAAWQVIGIDSSVALGISAEDPSKVELLNTFGLPEADYIPL